jgi:PIN domain nuclease of toxin-antitoxin system
VNVLDASAVLAWLHREPGWDFVEPLLADGVVSAANWSEILLQSRRRGSDPQSVARLLHALGVTVEPVTEADAEDAAWLWSADPPDLSLADRLCLALAARLGTPAVTADREWADAGRRVQLIR